MATVDTFKMKDGRKVTINWTCVKSIMKVNKNDWQEIQDHLKKCIDFINSPQYSINFYNSVFGKNNWKFSEGGRCLTIYRT